MTRTFALMPAPFSHGMAGGVRGPSSNAGSGLDLYAVIGHGPAPIRHLETEK